MKPRALVLLCALVLGACAPPEREAPSAGDDATPAATTACRSGDAFRRAIVTAVNRARRSGATCGGTAMAPVPPLAWSPVLADAAEAHARDMAAHDFVSHEGSEGRHVDRRASEAGYDWQAIGENVGAGADTVAQAVDHWLGSPGHCRNLLNADYSEFGAACARAPDSRYGTYWALILGQPQGR